MKKQPEMTDNYMALLCLYWTIFQFQPQPQRMNWMQFFKKYGPR